MRFEFSKGQMREMRERSRDICEAGQHGTEAMYGMSKGQTCTDKAQEFDHVVPTALARSKIQDIDEGLHVCKVHHKIKTHGNDRPKINKAKRIDEKRAGIPKSPMKVKIPSRGFAARLKPAKGAGVSPSHAKHVEKMRAKYGDPDT